MDEREKRLIKIVYESNKNDVATWAVAIDFSRSRGMKHHYQMEMIECIRRNGNINSYLKGIFTSNKIGDVNLNRKLTGEMIETHPIIGSLVWLAFNIPPANLIYRTFK